MNNQQYTIPKFHEQSFDWLTWRNGSIATILNIKHRESIILKNADIIKKYAIGYCEADNLPCRPKLNYIAIMFSINDELFWTHFTKFEFNELFKII